MSDPGSPPALGQEAGKKPARTQGIENDALPIFVSDHRTKEGGTAKRGTGASPKRVPVIKYSKIINNTGASSSKRPMKVLAESEDMYETDHESEKKHPPLEVNGSDHDFAATLKAQQHKGLKKPSEVLKEYVKMSQPPATGDRSLRTSMHPEMKIKLEVSNPKPSSSISRTDAEHFIMATLPETPPCPKQNAGIPRSTPGLGNQEYAILASVVPTRHEENTIAQRHIAIAKRRIMALFCQEVVVVVAKVIRVVRSARSLGEDEGLDSHMNLMLNYNKNVKSEGWRHQGIQWDPRQAQPDPGVDMGMQAHGMVWFSRIVPMAEVQEERQACMKEQDNMEEEAQWRGDEERSPDKTDAEDVENVNEQTEATGGHNQDHDATTMAPPLSLPLLLLFLNALRAGQPPTFKVSRVKPL